MRPETADAAVDLAVFVGAFPTIDRRRRFDKTMVGPYVSALSMKVE